LTCCKNNTGKLGQRSAWRRGSGGLFEPVLGFDWAKFDSIGKKCETQCWSEIPELIRENGGCVDKTDLSKLVEAKFGVCQKTASNQIKKAGQKGVIRFDMQRKGYVPA
jgi:hypothetical protein